MVRGAYNNPNRGANEFMEDGSAAYSHALQWALTGDKAHAEKVVEILDAYATMLESVDGHDARLLVGMAGIKYVTAAELIRHTSLSRPPRPRNGLHKAGHPEDSAGAVAVRVCIVGDTHVRGSRGVTTSARSGSLRIHSAPAGP